MSRFLLALCVLSLAAGARSALPSSTTLNDLRTQAKALTDTFTRQWNQVLTDDSNSLRKTETDVTKGLSSESARKTFSKAIDGLVKATTQRIGQFKILLQQNISKFSELAQAYLAAGNSKQDVAVLRTQKQKLLAKWETAVAMWLRTSRALYHTSLAAAFKGTADEKILNEARVKVEEAIVDLHGHSLQVLTVDQFGKIEDFAASADTLITKNNVS